MGKKKNNSRPGFRSSETGRFIRQEEAESNPSKTQRESIPKPGRGDTGRKKK